MVERASPSSPLPVGLAFLPHPSSCASLRPQQVCDALTVSRQPFDEDYLNHLEPPVKHMSFHAYIRKLTGGADK